MLRILGVIELNNMKENQTLTEQFDKILIEYTLDRGLEYMDHLPDSFLSRGEFSNLLLDLDEKQIVDLKKLIFLISKDIVFQFLVMFEENKELKLYYENDGHKIDIVEAAGMLLWKLHGSEGWIKKYSKYKDIVPEDE